MIKTWQQRCEEHPDHRGIVTGQMIRERMLEEIYELRQALAKPEQEPVAWDGACVLGHCASPSGCEESNCCRANYTAPVDTVNTSQERVDETEKGEHEPAAWSDIVSDGGLDPRNAFDTAPSKREWVGVTYDEVYEFVCTTDSYINLAKAIEAKLKEKNA